MSIPRELCSNGWHSMIWNRWKSQLKVDLPRTWSAENKYDGIRRRVVNTLRMISTYYPFGYYQGMLILSMPIHVIYEDDTLAFWSTAHLFELLKDYYGPAINLRYKLNTEDSERVVNFYCVTCRCDKGEITRLWAERAREFVQWRILSTMGLSLCKNLKSAVILCRFFLKYTNNKKKFRRCICALSYCILAGIFGRCRKNNCICKTDCIYHEKLNVRQVKALLQNVDFMSSLF